MCLYSINRDRTNKSNPEEVIFGYKGFTRPVPEGRFYGEFIGTYDGVSKGYMIGRWYQAVGAKRIKKDLGYYAGFHAFLNEEDALKWKGRGLMSRINLVIRKVKLTGRKTYGIQFAGGEALEVVVADKMLILRKEDNKCA